MSRRARAPTLAARVIAWQATQGRHDLPWQGQRDAYRIWLSEVMLQQTQVATVLGYYPRFVGRFPDVGALAAAPLDEVLALWSGLGYYSRARNLHRAAQQVVSRHGGRMPLDAGTLATLPGIGRSTAAAIAVFAAGERAAILDGNVKRVLTRALGFGDDLARPAAERALWALAESLLPTHGIESYTQGLMDLGATICLARRPRCGECPLAATCVAAQQGQPTAYPVKSRRSRRGQRQSVLLWLTRGSKLFVVRRPERGVWAGLWSLPEYPDAAGLQADLADCPGRRESLPSFVHVLTHLDWLLCPVRVDLPQRIAQARLHALQRHWPQGRWMGVPEALALGLPAPVRRLIAGGLPPGGPT